MKKRKTNDSRLREYCFSETFTSIQLASLYVLYYEDEFDFSKKKIQNFNEILRRHNKEVNDHIISFEELDKKMKKVGLDCISEAVRFPFRAKMKMVKNVKTRDIDIVLHSVNKALTAYFALAWYTLRTNYKFSIDKCKLWLEKVREFSMLYADGMKDEHVIEYFKMECELDVTCE